MNPFFAFSAIFALGLRGIENKTPLPYGPINSPGVTRETLIKLPTSLESATAAFKRQGSLAREVLGDYFVDHFAGTREHELEMHRRAVTSWEGECSASCRSWWRAMWRLSRSLGGPSGRRSECDGIAVIMTCVRLWGNTPQGTSAWQLGHIDLAV